MTTRRMAFAASTLLLCAAAGPARAERFVEMKYLGGLPEARRGQTGAIVLAGTELRFEDRKGRVVLLVSLAGVHARVGLEKRTTLGSVLRSTALTMVAIPLSAGMTDPSTAWSRDSRPVLVVRLGKAAGGATLRWRGPAARLQGIADAINRAACQSPAQADDKVPPQPPIDLPLGLARR